MRALCVVLSVCCAVLSGCAPTTTRPSAPESKEQEAQPAAPVLDSDAAPDNRTEPPPEAASKPSVTAAPQAPVAPQTPAAPQPAARPEPEPKPKATTVPAKPLAQPSPAPSPSPASAPSPVPVPAPSEVASSAPAIAGRLELVPSASQPVELGEVSDALIYFTPKAAFPAPTPRNFAIETHSKGFSPALLVVPVGSTVSFPNKDSILHNVFSNTPGTTFELGTYAPGQTREQIFRQPGLVIVNCNVHPAMRANVVVLATPYSTRPDKDGRFELTGLPPGPGTLVLWHPRSAAQSLPITVPSTAAVVRKLVAVRPRVGAHPLGH